MSRQFSALAEILASLAAVLLGLALVTGQFLFGGYGLLIFSLPTYLLVASAGLLGAAALWAGESRPFSPLCLVTAAAVAVYGLVRNAISADHRSAWVYTLLLAACTITYVLWGIVFRDNRSRSTVLAGLFLVGIAQLIFVGIQYFRDPSYHPLGFLADRYGEWLVSAGVQRVCGLHINANALAWALNVVTLAGLGVLVWARGPVWMRILIAYVCLLSLAGTVLTASRGGLVGLGAGLTVFLVLSLRPLFRVARNHSRRHVWALALTVALILGAIPAMLAINRSAAHRLGTLLNDPWRVKVMERTFLIGADSPMLGLGPHGLANASRRYLPGEGGDVDFAHDDWVQLFADYGAIGFSLAVLFLVAHFWNGWAAVRQVSDGYLRTSFTARSNRLALAVGALAATAACTIHSCFDFNTQLSGNVILLAGALGILAGRERNTGASSARQLQRALAVLLAGGSAWLGWQCLREARPEWLRLEADNAWARHDNPTLLRATTEGLAEDPKNSELRYLHGLALMQEAGQTSHLDEYDRLLRSAEEEFSLSLRQEPDETSPKLELAEALALQGRWDEALALDYAILTLEPSHAGGYMNLGRHLEASGDLENAVSAYQRTTQFPGGQAGPPKAQSLKSFLESLNSQRKVGQ